MKNLVNIDTRLLLEREEVNLDKYEISEFISNKTVLVTGGAGSIGSELCRQICLYRDVSLQSHDL